MPDGVNRYAPARVGWQSMSTEERLAKARELYAQAGYSVDEPLEVTLPYDASDIHETKTCRGTRARNTIGWSPGPRPP